MSEGRRETEKGEERSKTASGSGMVERFHSQTQRKVYGKAAAGRNVKNLREN